MISLVILSMDKNVDDIHSKSQYKNVDDILSKSLYGKKRKSQYGQKRR